MEFYIALKGKIYCQYHDAHDMEWPHYIAPLKGNEHTLFCCSIVSIISKAMTQRDTSIDRPSRGCRGHRSVVFLARLFLK